MYVAVSIDRFDDLYLQRDVIPFVTLDGEHLSLGQLRKLCAEYREDGFVVFPLDGCTHHDARGYCQGFELEQGGER